MKEWRTCRCDDKPENWLGNAPGVDLGSTGLLALVETCLPHRRSPSEDAKRLFDHVSRLPFFLADPAVTTVPSELHRQMGGAAYFKSTLWLHMLRVRGIPARMRWVEVEASKMTPGLWDFLRMAGMRFFHPMVEVWLDQCWATVDAYIMDPPLFARVRKELKRQGIPNGFFVHHLGVCDWSGRGDALQRFSPLDPDSLPLNDLGCYHSHEDFVARSGMSFERTELVNSAYKETNEGINVELSRLRLLPLVD